MTDETSCLDVVSASDKSELRLEQDEQARRPYPTRIPPALTGVQLRSINPHFPLSDPPESGVASYGAKFDVLLMSISVQPTADSLLVPATLYFNAIIASYFYDTHHHHPVWPNRRLQGLLDCPWVWNERVILHDKLRR